MDASNPTPPSGENVSGESARLVKCQDCGDEWLHSGHHLQTVLCPGCYTEHLRLHARYFYLLKSGDAEVEVQVTVPGEIETLAELYEDIHGWDRTDVYNELLNPQPEYIEEDGA